MVVAALLNVGASVMNGGAGTGAVDFFHGFQVALMLTVMFNLTQFVYWRCKISRRGSCWQVYQPAFYTLLSTLMVNVQPLAILIIGSWHLCCASCASFNLTCTGRTYPPWSGGEQRKCDMSGNLFWDESYCSGAKLPIFPTKTSGWLIQIFLTWGGFIFMFVGVMQATQLHRKLAKRWRAIRAGHR
jgi:hypothetical protein